MVRDAYSCMWLVAGAVSSTNWISLTHFTQVQPYQRGTSSRTGKPWSSGSGAPFICVARNAPKSASCWKVKIQLAPGTEFPGGDVYMSNPDTSTRVACGDTWNSPISFVIDTPPHSATDSIP